MWKLTVVIALSLPLFAGAQTACPQYSTMIQRAQQALNSNDPGKAFEYFRNAQIEGKLCHLKSTSEADNGIVTSFKALEKLKNHAEESEKKALAEEQRVKDALALLSKEREEKNKLIEDSRNKDNKLKEMGIDPFSLSGIKEKSGTNNAGPSSTFISGSNDGLNSDSYVSRLGFYTRAKSVLDSIDKIARAKNAAFINTMDDEESIISLTGRLELGNTDTRFSHFIMDSAMAELKNANPGSKNYEYLVYVFARGALYYGWKLTDIGQFDSAKMVYDEGVRFLGTVKSRSALIHYATAVLHNGYWNYSRSRNNEKEAYKHISTSVEEISSAVSINPYNSVYQRSMSVILRNVRNTPDSLLSKDDKEAIFKLGCQCAYNAMSYFPNSNSSLDAITTCAIEESNNLINKSRYTEAISSVRRIIDKMTALLKITPEKKDIFLQKSRLQVKVGDIYIRNLGDSVSAVKYLDSSLMTWKLTFKNETEPITRPGDAATVYDRFMDVISLLNQTQYKQKYNEMFLNAVSGFAGQYRSQLWIQYVEAMASRNMGEVYELSGKKTDSLKALGYFSRTVDILEHSAILSTYTYFSEDISNFCFAYSESVKMYLGIGDNAKASDTYYKMVQSFKTFYKNYPFDFYLNQKLKWASSKYGEYLYQTGDYQNAIPVLSLASYEADKRSSELLIAIFGDKTGKYYDTSRLQEIQERIKFQAYEMKKYTIPTYFGKSTVSFDYYIVDRDSLYPYRGIDDQVEWVQKARGGYITEEVRKAFLKIQSIAWQSNLSFGELAAYAIDEVNKEKVLQKYKALKDSIGKTNQGTAKLGLYDQLYGLYEADINKGGDYKQAITTDALVVYNDYSTYLIKNGMTDKAEKIIQRVKDLDKGNAGAYQNGKRIEYARNRAIILKPTTSMIVSDQKLYLQFSLEDLDFEAAHQITRNILLVDNKPSTTEELSEIYLRFTGDPNLHQLLLKDTAQLVSYYNYLLDKGINNLKTDDEKRVRYLNLVDLEEAILDAHASKLDLTVVASHYNSLAWFGILTKHYDGIFSYLNRSIALDSTSPYPLGNYPHAYLFTNNFERAKALYLKLKDQPFDNTNGLPKFKDAFLTDFKDFDRLGLMNDDLIEIRRLLDQ